jgi:hypothetical protein
MSDRLLSHNPPSLGPSERRGQSLVEFALVLPMLLVLLLGIADFGRAFQAGITVEAATRNAAEAAAQEYLQTVRNGGTPNYAALHLTAAQSVCDELQHLPNSDFSGGLCPTWPVVRVCVHDDEALNTECGDPIAGFNPVIPEKCDAMDGNGVPGGAEDPGWNPTKGGVIHGEASIYVEVRVCYLFTTMFSPEISLPMNTGISVGDIYLQDRSVFTVADY